VALGQAWYQSASLESTKISFALPPSITDTTKEEKNEERDGSDTTSFVSLSSPSLKKSTEIV